MKRDKVGFGFVGVDVRGVQGRPWEVWGKSTRIRGSIKERRRRGAGESMRITTSEGYHKPGRCDYDHCQRVYCHAHRMIWRTCETLKEGEEGDRDVIGGVRAILEEGGCPECERESEHKRDQAEAKAWMEWSDKRAESDTTELSISYWQEERGNRGRHI